MTAPNTVKVQRAQNGMITGACIKLSADDIVFVDSTVEMLGIHRKHSEDGIILEIKSIKPCSTQEAEFGTINHRNSSCLEYDNDEDGSAGRNREEYRETVEKNGN